jgi:glycosyltransferase involved in cell wall biosynthesis
MNEDSTSGLHVVVLNDYCHVQGGASRVAVDEAVGLAGAGANVTFVGAVGPVCAELKNAPLKVINLDQRQLSGLHVKPAVMLQAIWNKAVFASMGTVLESLDRRKTVVHVHGYTKSLSASPIRSATDRGFQVVCTLHDFFSACPNGAFFNFNENKPCHLKGLSPSCITTNCDKRHFRHKLYRVARSMAQRHLGNFPAGVGNYIALSNRSLELLRPYLPRSASVHLLANPIAIDRSMPVNVASNTRAIAIGRLDPEKGIKMFVDAARQTRFPITLVGEGPWRGYAEEYDGCDVTGWLTRPAVLAAMEQARCLVFPSLWYETFGLVVEEAAARGIPAIVSDVSAAAERVIPGVTGWHVRAGDTDDLARCLDVIKDDEIVRRVGMAAYNRYWDNPSTAARHSSALIAIYRDILTRTCGEADQSVLKKTASS